MPPTQPMNKKQKALTEFLHLPEVDKENPEFALVRVNDEYSVLLHKKTLLDALSRLDKVTTDVGEHPNGNEDVFIRRGTNGQVHALFLQTLVIKNNGKSLKELAKALKENTESLRIAWNYANSSLAVKLGKTKPIVGENEIIRKAYDRQVQAVRNLVVSLSGA